MSFGKDNSHLANVPRYGGSYSQRAANAGRKKTHKGSGSNRPYWSGVFKPSEHVADTIRLIPGEYNIERAGDGGSTYIEVLPWFECKEHYHGGKERGALCSAGAHFMDRKLRQPCHGCDLFWEGKDPGGKRKVSMSDKFAYAVLDMGLFHKVPQIDDNGQYKINPKTNEPYTMWLKCKRQGCTACQTAKESQVGFIQPWLLNKVHFNTLNGYAEGIGSCCVTCGGRGTISTVMWQCSNPNCGELVFDMSNTTATIEQIKAVVNDLYRCTSCGEIGYPEEVLQCVNCTPQGGTPIRATVFDVDMQVRLQKTGDGDQTALVIQATSDPKPIDPQFEALLKFKPDLAKRFAPSTLQYQAEIWGITKAPPMGGAQQHTQQYGQGR
jgi:hypothetical protein